MNKYIQIKWTWGDRMDEPFEMREVVGHLVNVFFYIYIKKPVCAPAVYAGRNKAQGRPRARQAGVISSVISFHHYLVTNIVWALNSILIKTVYVMCKIYLGVGVPLWGSAARLDDLSPMWRSLSSEHASSKIIPLTAREIFRINDVEVVVLKKKKQKM